MLDTPRLKFSVISYWRSAAGHKAHQDGCPDLACIHSASIRTVTAMRSSSVDFVCPWAPLPHNQPQIHGYTCTRILVLHSFWPLWICVHVFGACHCIAPPLNLEFQSMLKLDKKEQETMTNDVCFSGKWAENLDVPFTILRASIKLVYGR